MKIAVLIKQTPDTAELPKVSADDVQGGDVKTTMVINPWDEFAAEEAIDLCERFAAESVAISMGMPTATDALKHALAMGVGGAMLVDSSGQEKSDSWGTAAALAAAVTRAGDVELVLTGKQSVDGNSGAVFAGVACKLGFRLLTNVNKIVDITGGYVTVDRTYEGGQETVRCRLPAVISVSKEINDPRYPSFMGIRKASRAQIPSLTMNELALTNSGATATWTNIRKPADRKTDVVICAGDTVEEKAAKLVDALLAAKVI